MSDEFDEPHDAVTGELPAHERPISEQFRLVAKKWVDAAAAADLLSGMKKSTLAKFKCDYIEKNPGTADNAAERIALASDEWVTYLKSMIEAQKKSRLLWAQMEYLRMRHAEKMSEDATARREMGL